MYIYSIKINYILFVVTFQKTHNIISGSSFFCFLFFNSLLFFFFFYLGKFKGFLFTRINRRPDSGTLTRGKGSFTIKSSAIPL